MLPKAVLFDLDDTLVTEEKTSDIAWERVCELSARETGFFDGKIFHGIINNVRRQFWDNAQKPDKVISDIRALLAI